MLWRTRQPAPVFLPGASHGPRRLAGATVHGVAESRTRRSTHTCTGLWSGSAGARGADAASPGVFICQGDGRHQASRKQLSALLSVTQPSRRPGPRPLPPSATAPASLGLRGASKRVMPAAGMARHTSLPARPIYSQVGKDHSSTPGAERAEAQTTEERSFFCFEKSRR